MIDIKGITKSFGSLQVLDNVSATPEYKVCAVRVKKA